MRKLSYFLLAAVVAAAVVALMTLGEYPASAEVAAPPVIPAATEQGQVGCVTCHIETTPQIVSDWQQSAHSDFDVDCSVCHGEGHTSADDVAEVQIPTPDTCAECHQERVDQFSRGKHALAWVTLNAMPTTHYLPMALSDGMKGCGGCHKIGLKGEENIRALKANGAGFGVASCDACHTRHLFSVKEARQPQACQTCHMGFDHPQWEMYSASKHGVRALLKQNGTLPEDVAAPTCQTCHMQEGDHEVRTAWGFLAVRLPMPEDERWAANRATILQGLGRDKMIAVCGDCHSENFAREELGKGDDMIREADELMAEAIRIVAGLYQDGLLEKPEEYAYPFPDLLTFHDAPTEIEQELFVMFLEHRMRTFQGAFHNNPDYTLWYGWSEMLRSLTRIRTMDEEMRTR